MSYFPNNTISEFTTVLSPPLTLPPDCKVAVIHASFHNNWVNIDEKEAQIKIHLKSWTDDGRLVKTKSFYGHLPNPGNYTDTDMLIEYINSLQVEEDTKQKLFNTGKHIVSDFIKFEYNRASQTVFVRMNQKLEEQQSFKQILDTLPGSSANLILPLLTDNQSQPDYDGLTIEFTETIADMLGHRAIKKNKERDLALRLCRNRPEGSTVHIKLWHRFNKPVFTNSINNLFIYTDIVESSRLGDADAEYLCTIPVTSQPGQYQSYEPPKPIPRKVKNRRIETIRIKIGDLSGEKVKFISGSGEFNLVLKFKQKNK